MYSNRIINHITDHEIIQGVMIGALLTYTYCPSSNISVFIQRGKCAKNDSHGLFYRQKKKSEKIYKGFNFLRLVQFCSFPLICSSIIHSTCMSTCFTVKIVAHDIFFFIWSNSHRTRVFVDVFVILNFQFLPAVWIWEKLQQKKGRTRVKHRHIQLWDRVGNLHQ